MDLKADHSFSCGFANEKNDSVAFDKSHVAEFQFVKVKEEVEETKSTENTCDDIKFEEVILKREEVIEDDCMVKDVAVNFRCCHNISGKRFRVANEFGVLNCNVCCTNNVKDNQSEECVTDKTLSCTFDKVVSKKLVNTVDNGGSASAEISDSCSVSIKGLNFKMKFEKDISEPAELSVEKAAENKCDLEKPLNHIGVTNVCEQTSTRKRPFVCDVCKKSFTRLAHLKRHKLTHTGEKSFICDVCGKPFAYLNVLNIHKQTHTGDKPFICNVCVKPFARLCDLNVHKQTHMGDKPFVCDVCDKSFSVLSYLRKHKNLTHSGNKPFVCKICEKSFARLRDLTVHKRIHTGEKPFECNVCAKSFSYLNVLKIHKRTHSGEKPFACDVCGKTFAQLGHIKKHQLTHTGEQSFVCDICEKPFSRLCNLKKHMGIHNRQKPLACHFLENQVLV